MHAIPAASLSVTLAVQLSSLAVDADADLCATHVTEGLLSTSPRGDFLLASQSLAYCTFEV